VDRENQQQKTVVVLGTARSGTSVTAGMLASLGIDMGNVGHPSRSNPRGAFEDRDFGRLHKEIFNLVAEGKTYWDPPTRGQILEQKEAAAPRIERLILEKSKGKPIWGWKHPRTILTIDLFLPYLTNPHFIMVFRNPLAIAYSSVEHTKNRQRSVDFLNALKLANFYQREMVDFLERYPGLATMFVAFDDVVNDPMREAARMAEFLGIELDEKKTREVQRMVIPREQIEVSKKKVSNLLTEKIPQLIRKIVASVLGTRRRIDG
jgi:hypothetical protein